MTIDRIVMAFAGAMILASLGLAHFFGPWWLLLADLCRAESFPGRLYRFLPARARFEEIRRKAGRGVLARRVCP